MKTLYNFLVVYIDMEFFPLLKVFVRGSMMENSRMTKGELPAETRKLLEDLNRPYIEELAEYLGDIKYLLNEEVASDNGAKRGSVV